MNELQRRIRAAVSELLDVRRADSDFKARLEARIKADQHILNRLSWDDPDSPPECDRRCGSPSTHIASSGFRFCDKHWAALNSKGDAASGEDV